MSVQQHEKVLTILQGLTERLAAPKEERRSRERVAFPRSAWAILIGQTGMPRLRVYTRNLSTSGVGLVTSRGFGVGEWFVLPLRMKTDLVKLTLCRVRFVHYVSRGMYGVGAAFEAAVDAAPGGGARQIPEQWVEAARG